VVLEITSYTTPCNTIPAYFADGQFQRIAQKLHPGWSRVYARVLNGGKLKVGQVVKLMNGSNGSDGSAA
jgi:MOSC domain-containing protein YiiM